MLLWKTSKLKRINLNSSYVASVRLEGCIISHHATVREKASLKDCEVGPHYTVPAEVNKKSECLVRDDEDTY